MIPWSHLQYHWHFQTVWSKTINSSERTVLWYMPRRFWPGSIVLNSWTMVDTITGHRSGIRKAMLWPIIQAQISSHSKISLTMTIRIMDAFGSLVTQLSQTTWHINSSTILSAISSHFRVLLTLSRKWTASPFIYQAINTRLFLRWRDQSCIGVRTAKTLQSWWRKNKLIWFLEACRALSR